MALFLDTSAITKEISETIREAKKKLILISPYFQTSELLRERIRTKSGNSKLDELTIIYGKDELKKSELEWMQGINNLTILEKKNLHAKCYLNEQRAVICSMNLYEYSQQNNIEMGILITKKDDPEAFRVLLDEIKNIKHNSINKWGENAKTSTITYEGLSPNQKLHFKLIKELVGYELNRKKNENPVLLTTEELLLLASKESLNARTISNLLSQEKFDVYCEGILSKMKQAQYYDLGKIQRIIRSPENNYPKITLKLLNGEVKELQCAESRLPKETTIFVAVKINEPWFNEHFSLDN